MQLPCHMTFTVGVSCHMTYTVVVSLYDLHKEGGSVLHRLGEDLEQVAIVVKVHENVKLLQLHTHKKNVHQSTGLLDMGRLHTIIFMTGEHSGLVLLGVVIQGM